MKILNAGTTPLSNIDVLHWVRAKHAQHFAEDAADHDAGRKSSRRPENLLQALKKHEKELADPRKYPYTKNPSAYAEGRPYEAMARFDELLVERICVPLEERYRVGGEANPGGEMGKVEVERELGREQESKALTETEHLMLLNLAPGCVEQLQPMFEGCEERFTAEEQQTIVDCIVECYRADEPRADGGEMDVDGEGGAENGEMG